MLTKKYQFNSIRAVINEWTKLKHTHVKNRHLKITHYSLLRRQNFIHVQILIIKSILRGMHVSIHDCRLQINTTTNKNNARLVTTIKTNNALSAMQPQEI